MKKFFLTTCLVVVGLVGAQAQMKLTLSEAVSLALSENPTIKVANLEIERYDYVRKETWGALLPQISVSGAYTRSIVKPEIAKGLSFGADNSIIGSGDIVIPLFAPSVYRTLKMNETELESAVENARSSRINLIAEVKKSFYNILLAEQSLSVLRESKETIQQTVGDIELKFKNGLASEYDLITAQVQLSNLTPIIIQTENSVNTAKLLLKMYLSIPEDVVVSVDGALDDMRNDVLAGVGELNADVSENSELRKLDIQKEMLGHQLRLSNASRLPTVQAFGNATYSGNDIGSISFGGDNTPPPPSTKDFYWQHPVNVGLRLSIPIFSGLTKINKSRQIKNSMVQLDIQRTYAEQSVNVQVRSAINNLITAREMMFSQELTVAQSEKAYAISNTRYRSGVGTMLELNSAQLSQTQAQLNFSQAIFDFLTAKTEYDKIVGKEN